jgi:hypothetical protein
MRASARERGGRLRRTSRLRRGVLVASLTVLPVTCLAQQAADFKGRVFDATTRTGIENLEVKLSPPRDSKAAIRLTQTDRNGAFLVPKLTPGRYLLAVSQGMYLLYRMEVDTARQSEIEIPLTRKK